MNAVSLLYHDVIAKHFDESGVPGAGSAKYKLDRATFRGHVELLVQMLPGRCANVLKLGVREPQQRPYLLTFDDGGVSAVTEIAETLERSGLIGHFFIVTDFIGRPGFVTREQVRDLHARGHVIGTHSCSHPQRMSALPWSALLGEWRDSTKILADVIGTKVTVGSVPNGYYTRQVAQAAAEVGLSHLFTSEPTSRAWSVDGCRVIGRYGVTRGTSRAEVVAMAGGALTPRLLQWSSWNARKMAKRIGGETYLRARSAILQRARHWRKEARDSE